MLCDGVCLACCCDEWSGIGNCDVVILHNMHDVGGCFFLSLLRGRVITIPFASTFSFEGFFGVSSIFSAQEDLPKYQDLVQEGLPRYQGLVQKILSRYHLHVPNSFAA